MEGERSRHLQAAKFENSAEHSQQAAIFRLPLELRHGIYRYALLHSISFSPEKIYLAEESMRRPPPISLYFVNRQIHSELYTAVFSKPTGPLILHITPQGAFYSSFSETQILAGRNRDIARASKIHIFIWPPHPDRPADIFEIWRHARHIQRQLRQAAPLESLGLEFSNNKLASWCPNGRIVDTLQPDESPEAKKGDTGYNDITWLAQIFCRVRTQLAGILLPPELRVPGAFPETLEELYDVRSMMKGKEEIPNSYHNEVTLTDKVRYDDIWGFQELELQGQGARIAIQKLDDMTCNGEKKLSVVEWWQFLEIWNPHFETLFPGRKIRLLRERYYRR